LSSKNLESSIVFIGKIRENLNFLIKTVKNYTEITLIHPAPHGMPINFGNSPAGCRWRALETIPEASDRKGRGMMA
jgi:hypothetical protein